MANRWTDDAGYVAQDRRGRGPKGYTRSDERIREEACDRLTDHSGIDASGIEVNVSNGEVTLSGTVDHRGTKRAAEMCIEDISGTRHVQNNLRTEQPGTGEEDAPETGITSGARRIGTTSGTAAGNPTGTVAGTKRTH